MLKSRSDALRTVGAIACLIGLAVLGTVAGCGSGSGSLPGATPTPTPGTTPTPTPTPTPAVTVAVAPTAVTLTTVGAQIFTATVGNTSDSSVIWSVLEGTNGGTVTSAGVYTAPTAAGTYHVIATSVAAPTISASATITVTAQSGASAITVQ